MAYLYAPLQHSICISETTLNCILINIMVNWFYATDFEWSNGLQITEYYKNLLIGSFGNQKKKRWWWKSYTLALPCIR